MKNDLEFVIESVKEVGELILNYFHGDYDVEEKSKDNPVTSADLAADAELRKRFARRFPKDGWLSEETVDSRERLDRKRVWVVDPLDGTKEFVKGFPEFAISIALVEGREPRIAAVYNPARKDLFTAEKGGGAFRNGSTMKISSRRSLEGCRILASRSEYSQQTLAPLEEWAHIEAVGSIAFRLALLAAGDADVAISLRPKNEWDICAGGLLVMEAGGKITDLKGAGFSFNQENPLVQGVLAASPEMHSLTLDWIRQRPELQSAL